MKAKWLTALAAAALAGCDAVPKGIIGNQREAEARNAAAAERAAEAAAREQRGTERFNVVAIEMEANRIIEESDAATASRNAEMEAIMRDEKPATDKPAARE